MPADIYAIGFQEIVDLNAVNVALNNNNTQQRAQFWESCIGACLESTGMGEQTPLDRELNTLTDLTVCFYFYSYF